MILLNKKNNSFNSVILNLFQDLFVRSRNKFGMTALNKKNKLVVIALLNLLFVGFIAINFTSCCAYSFTGASVPEHLKTIAIPIADDRSGTGVSGVREKLTQTLIQKFIDDNTLLVSERTSANALLECTIVSLLDNPAIVTAGENISTWRATLKVNVIYRDLVKRKTVFEKTFTNYSDYDSNNPVTGRTTAIEETIDKISEDILLDTVSGW